MTLGQWWWAARGLQCRAALSSGGGWMASGRAAFTLLRRSLAHSHYSERRQADPAPFVDPPCLGFVFSRARTPPAHEPSARWALLRIGSGDRGPAASLAARAARRQRVWLPVPARDASVSVSDRLAPRWRSPPAACCRPPACRRLAVAVLCRSRSRHHTCLLPAPLQAVKCLSSRQAGKALAVRLGRCPCPSRSSKTSRSSASSGWCTAAAPAGAHTSAGWLFLPASTCDSSRLPAFPPQLSHPQRYARARAGQPRDGAGGPAAGGAAPAAAADDERRRAADDAGADAGPAGAAANAAAHGCRRGAGLGR